MVLLLTTMICPARILASSIARSSSSIHFAPKRVTSSCLRYRGKSTVDSSAFANAAGEASGASAVKAAADASSSSGNSAPPIGKTIAAMSLAIATVMGGAAAAEAATAQLVPTFDPKKERFDQSSFIGRLSKMLLACDPYLLTYSDEEVREYKSMVDNYQNLLKNLPEGVSEKEMSRKLWEAQRISSAALHPDTGDSIPHPFRMSGYVPFNGPICVAMVASTSTSALLFWSWVNQSQNALVNYYNRNASSEMTNETLLKSYSAAVGSALTVAFGLATFIQRRYNPAQAKSLMKFIAFPSAVVASSLNCYIVRSPEINTGVPLVDGDGENVLPNETSRIAAERGVISTTMSRAALQAPVYFLPPFFMSALPPIKNLIARNPMLSIPITTYLVLVCFGIGLPASVAIFPQMGEIKVEEAEDVYQKLLDKNGTRYKVLYYNKGL